MVGGLIWLQQHRRESKQPALAQMLIATPFIAGFIFVLSYPYLWRDAIGNSLNMLRYRTMSFDLQGALWEQVAVESKGEAIDRIWDRFTGVEWSVLGRFFGWGLPIEVVLAIVGMFILAVLVVRRGLDSATAMIAATIGSATLITIFGLQVDWARYHFPTLVAISLCIGVVFGTVERWISKGWRYR